MCTFFTSTSLVLIFCIQKLHPCISGISADCSGIIFDQLKFLKYHNNKKEKHTVYKNKNSVLKGFFLCSTPGVFREWCKLESLLLPVEIVLLPVLVSFYLLFHLKKNKRGRRLNNNYFFTHLAPHKLLDVY